MAIQINLTFVMGVTYKQIVHESTIEIPAEKVSDVIRFFLAKHILPSWLQDDVQKFLTQDPTENDAVELEMRGLAVVSAILAQMQMMSPADRLALVLEDAFGLPQNAITALLRSGRTARELSTMSVEELDTIRGIGPKLAARFVKTREKFMRYQAFVNMVLGERM